jgi:hypothetical protein
MNEIGENQYCELIRARVDDGDVTLSSTPEGDEEITDVIILSRENCVAFVAFLRKKGIVE